MSPVPYLSWSWDSIVIGLGCTWGDLSSRWPVFAKLKWTLEHPLIEELRRLWELKAELSMPTCGTPDRQQNNLNSRYPICFLSADIKQFE